MSKRKLTDAEKRTRRHAARAEAINAKARDQAGPLFADQVEQVTAADLATGLIYPPQSKILEASLHVAEKVAAHIFDAGLARVPRPDDIGALIRQRAYRPVYPE